MLHRLIVLAQPGSHLLTYVPGGVVPNQHQHMFALRLDLLAQPLQKIGGHLADRASCNKAEVHATTGGGKHSITGKCFRIGIVLVHREFLQTEWLVLFTPAVQVRLAQPAPPHLIQVADLPSAALCQRNQGVTAFFLPGILGIRTGDPVFRALPADSQVVEGKSDGLDTHLASVNPCSKHTYAANCQGPTAGRFAERSGTLM